MNLRPDIPKTLVESDLLYSKAIGLKNFFENNENDKFLSKNNIIALYGKWGSGKSSVFQTLSSKLNPNKFLCVNFETWKYEKDENLPSSLIDSILSNIINNNSIFPSFDPEKLKEIFIALSKSIKAEVGLPIPGYNGNIQISPYDAISYLNENNNKKSLYSNVEKTLNDYKKNVKDQLKEKKIIVFIDDLDRCNDENIITLLTSLKLMLSFEETIFLCGVDKEAVIETLFRKYSNREKAEKFLEKIFAFEFNIYDEINKETVEERVSEFTDIKFDILEVLNTINHREVNKVFNKYLSLCKFIDVKNLVEENKNEKENYIILNKLILFIFSVLFVKNKINYHELKNINIWNMLRFYNENNYSFHYDNFDNGSSTKLFEKSFKTIYSNKSKVFDKSFGFDKLYSINKYYSKLLELFFIYS